MERRGEARRGRRYNRCFDRLAAENATQPRRHGGVDRTKTIHRSLAIPRPRQLPRLVFSPLLYRLQFSVVRPACRPHFCPFAISSRPKLGPLLLSSSASHLKLVGPLPLSILEMISP